MTFNTHYHRLEPGSVYELEVLPFLRFPFSLYSEKPQIRESLVLLGAHFYLLPEKREQKATRVCSQRQSSSTSDLQAALSVPWMPPAPHGQWKRTAVDESWARACGVSDEALRGPQETQDCLISVQICVYDSLKPNWSSDALFLHQGCFSVALSNRNIVRATYNLNFLADTFKKHMKRQMKLISIIYIT